MNKTILKPTLLPLFAFIVLSAVLCVPASAQEAETPATPPAPAGTKENPGMGLLEQATEAKLNVQSAEDLKQVIVLCQRAKKAGLVGENLKYCDQLLASTQLQRGLFFAQQVLGNPNARPADWKSVRDKALTDLNEAVVVITDNPAAYIRIAQLTLIPPEGDKNKAKEALQKAAAAAKDDVGIQIQAVQLLAALETNLVEREKILAAQAASGNLQILLLHAVTLFELRRSADAVNALQKVLDKEKDNAELQERIISLLLEYREFDAANRFIDQFAANGTEDQKIALSLQKVLLLVNQNKDEEAKKAAAVILEKNSDRVEVLAGCSDILMMLDDYDKALQCVNQALTLRPGFPVLLLQKIKILMAAEKFGEAQQFVKNELRQIIADESAADLMECQILSAMKQYDKVLEIAKKKREQEPEDQRWISLQIGTLAKKKDFDQALELVNAQRKADPEMLQWLVLKVQLFDEQKKWDEAIKELETYLKAHPDAKEVRTVLIGTLMDKKDYAAAKAQLKLLLEKEPDDLGLLRIDSQLAISSAAHAEAVKLLDAILQKDPNDATSLNNLAWIYATSPTDTVRNAQKALELALKASELTRYRKAFILSTLAAAYAEGGNFEKAKEWAKKSIDAAQKDKEKSESAQKELMESLQKEWNTYQQNKPYREEPEKN